MDEKRRQDKFRRQKQIRQRGNIRQVTGNVNIFLSSSSHDSLHCHLNEEFHAWKTREELEEWKVRKVNSFDSNCQKQEKKIQEKQMKKEKHHQHHFFDLWTPFCTIIEIFGWSHLFSVCTTFSNKKILSWLRREECALIISFIFERKTRFSFSLKTLFTLLPFFFSVLYTPRKGRQKTCRRCIVMYKVRDEFLLQILLSQFIACLSLVSFLWQRQRERERRDLFSSQCLFLLLWLLCQH